MFLTVRLPATALFVVLAMVAREAAASHLPELPGEQSSEATAPDLDLDLLGDDLLEKLNATPPASEDGSGQKPHRQPHRGELQSGEDLGAAPEKLDPLEEIGRQMREIERRMLANDISADTLALQKQVSDEIAKLIEQLQHAQPNATGAKQQQQKPRKKQGEQQEGAGQNAGTETADHPASESRDRLGSPGENSPEMQDVPSLLREVWGNLPQRVRGQMQNASVEQFLPQYDLLIREYFKRLTRQNDASPNN